MKPRSTVAALLAITETLIAARKAARAKQASSTPVRPSKVARLLNAGQPLALRIKAQTIS